MSALSHAVQRGSTVFDVIRVCPTAAGPAILGLRPHMARFERSMDLMGMTPAHTLAELEEAVVATVRENPGADLVKVSALWTSTPFSTLPDSTTPVIMVAALTVGLADPAATKPITVAWATVPKLPPEVLPPGLKVAASYTYGLRDKLAAVEAGADEIILRTQDGDLAEAVSQSVFLVRDASIVVPPLDVVLDGITRRLVLEVAHHLGHHSSTRAIDAEELVEADELFLCSTTSPVLPVAALAGTSYDAPGPLSQELIRETIAVMAGTHPLSSRWLTVLAET